ncbi:Phosphatidylinositol kinase like protein [Aduncisulcus paluster]|uniref:Phosphatidylinositol kinase like protein n=1 Tax=Aduncisulcus paluster TaxID=2918883 RepID=A0ABQ5KJW6_9EUKA|nr:Phosphatidylinositol kinase like protein [Aduncisulcus paluster]
MKKIGHGLNISTDRKDQKTAQGWNKTQNKDDVTTSARSIISTTSDSEQPQPASTLPSSSSASSSSSSSSSSTPSTRWVMYLVLFALEHCRDSELSSYLPQLVCVCRYHQAMWHGDNQRRKEEKVRTKREQERRREREMREASHPLPPLPQSPQSLTSFHHSSFLQLDEPSKYSDFSYGTGGADDFSMSAVWPNDTDGSLIVDDEDIHDVVGASESNKDGAIVTGTGRERDDQEGDYSQHQHVEGSRDSTRNPINRSIGTSEGGFLRHMASGAKRYVSSHDQETSSVGSYSSEHQQEQALPTSKSQPGNGAVEEEERIERAFNESDGTGLELRSSDVKDEPGIGTDKDVSSQNEDEFGESEGIQSKSVPDPSNIAQYSLRKGSLPVSHVQPGLPPSPLSLPHSLSSLSSGPIGKTDNGFMFSVPPFLPAGSSRTVSTTGGRRHRKSRSGDGSSSSITASGAQLGFSTTTTRQRHPWSHTIGSPSRMRTRNAIMGSNVTSVQEERLMGSLAGTSTGYNRDHSQPLIVSHSDKLSSLLHQARSSNSFPFTPKHTNLPSLLLSRCAKSKLLDYLFIIHIVCEKKLWSRAGSWETSGPESAWSVADNSILTRQGYTSASTQSIQPRVASSSMAGVPTTAQHSQGINLPDITGKNASFGSNPSTNIHSGAIHGANYTSHSLFSPLSLFFSSLESEFYSRVTSIDPPRCEELKRQQHLLSSMSSMAASLASSELPRLEKLSQMKKEVGNVCACVKECQFIRHKPDTKKKQKKTKSSIQQATTNNSDIIFSGKTALPLSSTTMPSRLSSHMTVSPTSVSEQDAHDATDIPKDQEHEEGESVHGLDVTSVTVECIGQEEDIQTVQADANPPLSSSALSKATSGVSSSPSASLYKVKETIPKLTHHRDVSLQNTDQNTLGTSLASSQAPSTSSSSSSSISTPFNSVSFPSSVMSSSGESHDTEDNEYVTFLPHLTIPHPLLPSLRVLDIDSDECYVFKSAKCPLLFPLVCVSSKNIQEKGRRERRKKESGLRGKGKEYTSETKRNAMMDDLFDSIQKKKQEESSIGRKWASKSVSYTSFGSDIDSTLGTKKDRTQSLLLSSPYSTDLPSSSSSSLSAAGFVGFEDEEKDVPESRDVGRGNGDQDHSLPQPSSIVKDALDLDDDILDDLGLDGDDSHLSTSNIKEKHSFSRTISGSSSSSEHDCDEFADDDECCSDEEWEEVVTIPSKYIFTSYVLFKYDDDVRQDQMVAQMKNIMGAILRREHIQLNMIKINTLALSPISGIVQVIRPSIDLQELLGSHKSIRDYWIFEWKQKEEAKEQEEQQSDKSKIGGGQGSISGLSEKSDPSLPSAMASSLFAGYERRCVDNFVKTCVGGSVLTYLLGVGDRHLENILVQPNGNMFHIDFGAMASSLFAGYERRCVDNFVKTCVGGSVLTYLLGVGDRHLENILVQPNGNMFHIDFGYMLGRDPKAFAPAMKLSKAMVEAMGGPFSDGYKQFKELSCESYLILRRHANLFFNLFKMMVGERIQTFDEEAACSPPFPALHDTFRLDLSEDEAMKHFSEIIQTSVSALFPAVIDIMHKFAQALRS